MDSWINQDVVQSALGGGAPVPYIIPATFNNRSNVVNLGTRYAWTPQFSTCASVEYVHGLNATNIPVAAGGYDLGPYSLVQSNTIRLSLGVDYLWRPGITTFARYDFYDFEDLGGPGAGYAVTPGSTNTNQTGQTNLFLVGMSAKF